MTPPPGFDPEHHAGRFAPAGAVLAVAGGCVGGWLGALLASVGLLLLLTACVSRTDGLIVLGPFVRAELARAARGKRPWLWRAVYALAAGAILIGNVAAHAPQALGFDTVAVRPNQLEGIAGPITLWFSVVLFGYVSFLTVTLIAPIVSEEREAKRWDLLLTTDLRGRELLLGKAAGRLPQVLDPVLASLPVLAVTPLLGGVSPTVVAGVAVATLATVAGLTGVSFFYSVFMPTGRRAIDQTVGTVALYLLCSPMLYLLMLSPKAWTFPTSVGGPSTVLVSDVVDWVNAGNPVSTMVSISARPTGPFEDDFGRAVQRYAVFQGGVMALFGLTAIARVRRAKPWTSALMTGTTGPAVNPRAKASAAALRPSVGDEPVYWWERYGGLNRAQLWMVNGLTPRRLVILAVSAVVLLLWTKFLDQHWPWGRGRVAEFVEGSLRAVIACMAVISLIGPLFRAARTVAHERVTGTLEGLRLTALDGADILFQKWAAAAASELPLGKVILAIALAGVVTGFVSPLTIPALAILLPIYAGSGAAFGIYFSVRAATPGKAVRNLILLGIGVLYLLGIIASALFQEASIVAVFPPFAIAFATFPEQMIKDGPSRFRGAFVPAFAFGLLMYSVVGWFAWKTAASRFERERQT